MWCMPHLLHALCWQASALQFTCEGDHRRQSAARPRHRTLSSWCTVVWEKFVITKTPIYCLFWDERIWMLNWGWCWLEVMHQWGYELESLELDIKWGKILYLRTLNKGSAVSVCIIHVYVCVDRLCGLVVRVPGYRSTGSRFDSWRCQIFWEVVGLEQGPLSLVRIIEELPEWKSSGSSLENRN
jgi:hypothetical protein